MNLIICILVFIGIFTIFISTTTYFALKKTSTFVCSSRYIVNKFKIDNDVFNITKMVEFHKANKDLKKYTIESETQHIKERKKYYE